MDPKQAVLQQIESLKTALSGARAVLRSIEHQERLAKQANLRQTQRFYNMRPKVAAEMVIDESPDRRVHIEELIKILLDGGIAIGRKRSHNNVRIGLEKTIALKGLQIDAEGFVSKPDK